MNSYHSISFIFFIFAKTFYKFTFFFIWTITNRAPYYDLTITIYFFYLLSLVVGNKYMDEFIVD